MTNSKRKGKCGELEAAHAIEDAWGLKVRRTAQVDGKLSADLLIEGRPGLHLEVKRRKRIASMQFLYQAVADAAKGPSGPTGLIPVVISREDGRGGWAVTIALDDAIDFATWIKANTNTLIGMQLKAPAAAPQ